MQNSLVYDVTRVGKLLEENARSSGPVGLLFNDARVEHILQVGETVRDVLQVDAWSAPRPWTSQNVLHSLGGVYASAVGSVNRNTF